jgi:uncharacterized protein (DUF433 family)
VLFLAFDRFARPLGLRPAAKAKLYKTLVSLITAPKRAPRAGLASKADKAAELAKYIEFKPGKDLNKWRNLLETYARRRNEYVEIDDEIMGGTPVVRRTRVPVYTVLHLVDRGRSIDQILEELPYVSREGVEAAVIYARSHPRTGKRKIFR